jgi:uncharacterized protein involved in exopolysaccharide biosynthesis
MPLLFPTKWDAQRHDWIAGRPPPTEASGIRRLHSKFVKISEDKRTGLLTLTFDWPDPNLAYRWANDFVAMANEGLRSRTLLDAQAEIDYLNGEIEKTQSVQVREALNKIIETQLKTLALAHVREDYAFRVVDAAILPDAEDKVFPKRALFGAAGLIIGAALCGWLRLRFARRVRS